MNSHTHNVRYADEAPVAINHAQKRVVEFANPADTAALCQRHGWHQRIKLAGERLRDERGWSYEVLGR